MRYKIVFFVIFFIFILLLSKVYYLSIKSNSYFEALAKQNMIKKEYIVPIRGEIFDRKGKPLAVNNVGFKLTLAPHLGKKRLETLLKEVVKNFPDQNITKLYRRYKKRDSFYNHDFIEIIPFIEYDSMLGRFAELRFEKELKIEPSFKRYYPHKDLASHVLGYVSKTNKKEAKRDLTAKIIGITGKTGIEKFYNSYLEGKIGYKKVKVSAYNEELGILEKKEPVQNRDLYLTIDIELQKYIKELFKNRAGVAIVMRTDGEILAAGSYPGYDLNIFVNGISRKKWQQIITDLNHPFTNKLVNGLYPPGSTIKMGVALAFLNSRLISPFTPFYCSGHIKVGKRKFRCWSRYGHGEVRLRKAIRESCDVYFYEGGLRVGINKIAKELRKMGFSKKSGVDLPNEFIGVIPDKEWKSRKYGQPWYKGETVVSAIGQGYTLVTPMQIARYTAFLASGTLPVPHFAKSFNEKVYESKKSGVRFSEREKRLLTFIREGMYDVCNHKKGTASKYIDTNITIAGKTGTAQVIGIPQEEKERMKEEELAYFTRSHAWLTTYGPYKNPQVVVTVLMEHGGHGGSAAGPIVSKIYDKLIELGYIRGYGSKQR